MALDKNLHKTGGFHPYFHSLGPFWDVKSPVITAALPGSILKKLKKNHKFP
jgi:hypothetical protein